MTITVNVARSADEAERLARGEDVTVAREEAAAPDAEAAAEAFFEPEVVEARRAREQAPEPEAEPKKE